mmetsp:Transcript_58857/g.68789  ORF Transcript_58857/g.68789 Transcript_58857/m.68789 type:complete len:84 (-) Transcript_58857:466-717(-)
MIYFTWQNPERTPIQWVTNWIHKMLKVKDVQERNHCTVFRTPEGLGLPPPHPRRCNEWPSRRSSPNLNRFPLRRLIGSGKNFA